MKLVASLLCIALSGCASTLDRGADPFAPGVFKTAPTVAVNGELGSSGNPVRVLMPQGEREYLHRLRCENGGPPTFKRSGSAGFGPYGKILDAYAVVCPERSVTVYMDMYHCVEEDRPVPGLQIVPEVGTRPKDECN